MFQQTSKNSFRKVLLPYWILGAIFSQCHQLTEVKKHYRLGRVLVSIYVGITYCFTAWWLIENFGGHSPIFEETMIFFAQFLNSMSSCLTALAVITFTIIHQKDLYQLRQKMDKLESFAKQFLIWKSYKPLIITFSCYTFITISGWLVLLWFTISECIQDQIKCLIIWFVLYFPTKINEVYMIIFCWHIVLVRHMLSMLTARLSNMCETSSKYSHIEKSMTIIQKAFNRTVEVHRIVERIYGVPLFLNIINQQIDLFTNLYLFLNGRLTTDKFLKYSRLPSKRIGMSILYSLETFGLTTFVCFIGQLTIYEFGQMKRALYDFPSNKYVVPSKKIIIFSRHLLHEDFHLSACGFVSINSALIKSVLGSVGVYLVMFIQFNMDIPKFTYLDQNHTTPT